MGVKEVCYKNAPVLSIYSAVGYFVRLCQAQTRVTGHEQSFREFKRGLVMGRGRVI